MRDCWNRISWLFAAAPVLREQGPQQVPHQAQVTRPAGSITGTSFSSLSNQGQGGGHRVCSISPYQGAVRLAHQKGPTSTLASNRLWSCSGVADVVEPARQEKT